MATIRWCPIAPKWDIYQSLFNDGKMLGEVMGEVMEEKYGKVMDKLWKSMGQLYAKHNYSCFRLLKNIEQIQENDVLKW